MANLPTRKYMTGPEAIAFIREHYTNIQMWTFYRRLRDGHFKALHEPTGSYLIDVKSLIEYYEPEPTVEYDFTDKTVEPSAA